MNTLQRLSRQLGVALLAAACGLFSACSEPRNTFSYKLGGIPYGTDKDRLTGQFSVEDNGTRVLIKFSASYLWAGGELTIPGNQPGSYENTAQFLLRPAQFSRPTSIKNAFSAAIESIDPHFIKGTFHGDVDDSYAGYPQPYAITDGEFQLYY